jgi:SAM-dependent methyltransferase
MEPVGPNAGQIRYWNETVGPKWVALHEVIDAQVAPLGIEVMERAGIGAGAQILDVGCGCGDTTVELARRVGAAGSATGVDVSAVMLERARQVAAAAGVTNVRFEQADAETHPFPPLSFDFLYSRFGLMFFANTEAALANLGRALRPGGCLAFVCWRRPQDNPWMIVPLMAAAEHIPLPAPPAPGAPGPFALADEVRLRTNLERAGYVDVTVEAVDREIAVGGGMNLEGAVQLALQMGPTAAALREAGGAARPQVEEAVRKALTPYATGDGVRLSGGAWIVTSRKA